MKRVQQLLVYVAGGIRRASAVFQDRAFNESHDAARRMTINYGNHAPLSTSVFQFTNYMISTIYYSK